MKSNLKKIIIVVIILALLGVAYWYFFVNSAPAAKPTSALSSSKTTTSTTSKTPASTTDSTNKKVTNDTAFLSTLLSISKINVDATIFSSNSFNTLQDNNVPIVNEEITGRSNPFAPLDAVPEVGVVNVSPVTTLPASLITSNSAVVSGEVSSGSKAQLRFFEWGKSEAVLDKRTTPSEESLVGTFTSTLTGLTPKTKYYFRASIKVGNSNVIGEVMSFTTN